jgi:hypothetical protein
MSIIKISFFLAAILAVGLLIGFEIGSQPECWKVVNKEALSSCEKHGEYRVIVRRGSSEQLATVPKKWYDSFRIGDKCRLEYCWHAVPME